MTVPGPRTLTATVLVLVATFVVGLTASQLAGPRSLPDWLAWSRPAGVTAGRALGPSEPVRIEIPSAGVDAEVRPVGLDHRSGKGLVVVHRCTRCGFERPNRLAVDTVQPDDLDAVARLFAGRRGDRGLPARAGRPRG